MPTLQALRRTLTALIATLALSTTLFSTAAVAFAVADEETQSTAGQLGEAAGATDKQAGATHGGEKSDGGGQEAGQDNAGGADADGGADANGTGGADLGGASPVPVSTLDAGAGTGVAAPTTFPQASYTAVVQASVGAHSITIDITGGTPHAGFHYVLLGVNVGGVFDGVGDLDDLGSAHLEFYDLAAGEWAVHVIADTTVFAEHVQVTWAQPWARAQVLDATIDHVWVSGSFQAGEEDNPLASAVVVILDAGLAQIDSRELSPTDLELGYFTANFPGYEPGRYTARLTVSTTHGDVAEASDVFEIAEPEPKPTPPELTIEVAAIDYAGNVTLTGTITPTEEPIEVAAVVVVPNPKADGRDPEFIQLTDAEIASGKFSKTFHSLAVGEWLGAITAGTATTGPYDATVDFFILDPGPDYTAPTGSVKPGKSKYTEGEDVVVTGKVVAGTEGISRVTVTLHSDPVTQDVTVNPDGSFTAVFQDVAVGKHTAAVDVYDNNGVRTQVASAKLTVVSANDDGGNSANTGGAPVAADGFLPFGIAASVLASLLLGAALLRRAAKD
jgi:hypothetical protein